MITLTITPEDPNYVPEKREFATRETAQSKVDELYGNRHISREEWNRLFDVLSKIGEKTFEPTRKVEPEALVSA